MVTTKSIQGRTADTRRFESRFDLRKRSRRLSWSPQRQLDLAEDYLAPICQRPRAQRVGKLPRPVCGTCRHREIADMCGNQRIGEECVAFCELRAAGAAHQLERSIGLLARGGRVGQPARELRQVTENDRRGSVVTALIGLAAHRLEFRPCFAQLVPCRSYQPAALPRYRSIVEGNGGREQRRRPVQARACHVDRIGVVGATSSQLDVRQHHRGACVGQLRARHALQQPHGVGGVLGGKLEVMVGGVRDSHVDHGLESGVVTGICERLGVDRERGSLATAPEQVHRLQDKRQGSCRSWNCVGKHVRQVNSAPLEVTHIPEHACECHLAVGAESSVGSVGETQCVFE